MIITDLDGTLLNSDQKLGEKDRETLLMLGEQGQTRVVATGRILHSAKQVLSEDFPIDYLIFSSGAGILNYHTKELIHANFMETADLMRSLDLLEKRDLNFMVHSPVPENHFCLCKRGGDFDHKDYDRRVAHYQNFYTKWEERSSFFKLWDSRASVIVSSVPQEMGLDTSRNLRDSLSGLHVVRATSPVDPEYNWLEILPPGVSKASGCQWLKDHLGLTGSTLVVGNDYNDLDMLEWGDKSYVVKNSPGELKKSYPVVSSNNTGGFSEAVTNYFHDISLT